MNAVGKVASVLAIIWAIISIIVDLEDYASIGLFASWFMQYHLWNVIAAIVYTLFSFFPRAKVLQSWMLYIAIICQLVILFLFWEWTKWYPVAFYKILEDLFSQ